MCAEWTANKTQSLNLITDSQQHSDTYSSQQKMNNWYIMLKSSCKIHKIKTLAKILNF